MESFRFEHPNYLFALLALLVFWLLYFAARRWRRRNIRKLGDEHLVDELLIAAPRRKRFVKFLLLTLGLGFGIVAVANPQLGREKGKAVLEGVDIFLALDVSKSMLAEDVRPTNRLRNARQFLSNLIDELGNDRVGFIIFAGNAYLQMPLTSDHSAAKLFLKSATPDLIPTQGTAFADAVELAEKSFTEGETKHKVMVIVSDGENHEEGAMEVVTKAHENGTIIYTVGVGSTKGARIPEYTYGRKTGFKKDKEGNFVLSKLNESMLNEIAKKGGGAYYNLNGGNSMLKALRASIESVETKQFGESQYRHYATLFYIPLSLALCFLLFDLFVFERKTLAFSKWKIFEGS